MIFKKYVPNERLCRLAARLWRNHMEVPEFDQLGKGETRRGNNVDDFIREAMCQSIQAQVCSKTTKEQLDKFEEGLLKLLMTKFPYKDLKDSEQTTIYTDGRPPTKHTYSNEYARGIEYETELCVDYSPNNGLLMAGQIAGLPDIQFPIKSRMRLSNSGAPDEFYLSASFGYGAPHRYFYPLENDDLWLVTTLQEDPAEIKILKFLHPHFTVTKMKEAR